MRNERHSRAQFDPVTLEILWTRLVSMVDEAAAQMVRTAFSTIVRDSNDYAVVLLDTRGRSLAQSTLSIPSFICTLPATVKHLLAAFPLETLRPGDVLTTNDPWLGTGHLPDINVAMPIFRRGKVVAIAATVAHSPDVGGRLRSPEIRELYEEGLRIMPSKLLERGKPEPVLWRILETNVRVPEQVMGDLWAQVTANRFLGERVVALIDETGIDIDALGAEVQRRSESAMRAAIREVPDGEYSYRLESDGFEQPLVIATRVRVKGDTIAVDYTGSSAQLPKAINVVPSYTFAYTAFALKCLLSPAVPNNEGSFKPLTVTAPPGSVLNPHYPAPVGARAMTGHMLPPVIMGALTPALPDRVQAPSGSPQWCVHLAGAHQGRRFATVCVMNGGQGASARRPGLPSISFPSNLANTPIEAIETQTPMVMLGRDLRRGSGGAGAQPGGDGQRFAFRILADTPTTMSFMANRLRAAAPGLNGGGDGALGAVRLNGTPIDPRRTHIINTGDVVEIDTPGGGGYGRPA